MIKAPLPLQDRLQIYSLKPYLHNNILHKVLLQACQKGAIINHHQRGAPQDLLDCSVIQHCSNHHECRLTLPLIMKKSKFDFQKKVPTRKKVADSLTLMVHCMKWLNSNSNPSFHNLKPHFFDAFFEPVKNQHIRIGNSPEGP